MDKVVVLGPGAMVVDKLWMAASVYPQHKLVTTSCSYWWLQIYAQFPQAY